MSYYKTNAPAVLAAWNQVESEVAQVKADGEKFARHFGGKAQYYADPCRLAGLVFISSASRDLWTARSQYDIQRPLANPRRGATDETKAALKALQADWKARWPETESRRDALYAALGVSWGDFLFSGGLEMFERDGWVYAETGRDMPVMQEILGSEYKAAKVAGGEA